MNAGACGLTSTYSTILSSQVYEQSDNKHMTEMYADMALILLEMWFL